MRTNERDIIAEQGKLLALRERVRAVAYMTTGEVRAHLHMGRATLYGIPSEVLPWAPTPGGERRYHPADVAAYPAKARRWARAKEVGREAETLTAFAAELEERDRRTIADALTGWAA